MAEIRGGELQAAEPRLELAQLLMRQRQELGQEAELMHQLERRGMNGVAAEIAEEIRVLLQHDHVHSGARQQEAEHHAGRPAAGDAAARPGSFARSRAVAH
jgi:hypothetical protein